MTRLQNQFLREKSFDGYSDSSVLETMLSVSGVRGDIHAMIENLYDSFGSFKAILEARHWQLMNVPLVTEKAATMISMIAPLARVSGNAATCRISSRFLTLMTPRLSLSLF